MSPRYHISEHTRGQGQLHRRHETDRRAVERPLRVLQHRDVPVEVSCAVLDVVPVDLFVQDGRVVVFAASIVGRVVRDALRGVNVNFIKQCVSPVTLLG